MNRNNTTDSNSTQYHYDPEEDKRLLEIYIFIALIALAADIVIGFVIVRNKRLLSKKYNVCILQWCITNGLFLVLSPITLRLQIDSYDYHIISKVFFCNFEELSYTCLLANIFFVILLTFYWYFEHHHPAILVKLERNLNFFIIFIYILALSAFGIEFLGCVNRNFFMVVGNLLLVLGILVFIAFMIIMNIIHFIKKLLNRNSTQTASNLTYILTNVFFLSLLPMILSIITVGIFRVHAVLIYISIMLGVFNPVYNLIILYKNDDDFNLFIRHLITCKCKQYPEEFMEEPFVFSNSNETVKNDQNV